MSEISRWLTTFLLNAVWQITAITMLAFVCVKLLRRMPSRYAPSDKSLLESADGKDGDSGDSAAKNLCSENHTNPLTPTGLLMEGDFAQNL
jgi:hypothetical protein